MQDLEISKRVLAKNTILNLIGQALPLVVGVFTIPFVIRGLGMERFGIFSLSWVILGYFIIFDLGIGRATTKFIAEALGKGEKGAVTHIIWTSATIQGIFGIFGAIVAVSIIPLLVEHILSIPPSLKEEAKTAFYLIALGLPVILVSSSFLGALEAIQRFDLVNAVRVLSNTLTFLLPLLGIILGFQVPGIVALILASRFILLLALVAIDFKVFPELSKFSLSFTLFLRLFSYGRWIMVTIIIGPILIYLDRFLIGTLLSMAAVAYYIVPYEVVIRLWIISNSLNMTLFPAFSALQGANERQKLEMLLVRSIKYVLLTLGPIVLMVTLFANEILEIWLGSEFATKSTLVMQILAVGVLINSLAHTTFGLLQGVGRPDITAKIHLFELPIHIVTAWLLINHWGIVGAAVAWTMRVTLDALLLFIATLKVCRFSPRILVSNGLKLSGLALIPLVFIAYFLKRLGGILPSVSLYALYIVVFALFVRVVWRNVLDNEDRAVVHVVHMLLKAQR